MKIKCPVCGGDLIYEHRFHGVERFKIDRQTNEVKDITKPGGNIYVICSLEREHEIPIDIYDKAVEMVKAYTNEKH